MFGVVCVAWKGMASYHHYGHAGDGAMKRFTTSLALFVSGLRLLSGRGEATPIEQPVGKTPKDVDPVKLRPLNLEGDNLFAAHRSHSSHSSHSSHQSHRSGSGGGIAPAPATESPP